MSLVGEPEMRRGGGDRLAREEVFGAARDPKPARVVADRAFGVLPVVLLPDESVEARIERVNQSDIGRW